MRSMTGYGSGEQAQDGFKVTVELSSVNRKQSEIVVSLPRELEALEPQVRDEMHRHVSRGRLNVRVNLHSLEGHSLEQVRINTGLARQYQAALNNLARELKLKAAISLEFLAKAPGVMESPAIAQDASAYWPPLEKALRRGAAALVAMRDREGAHLAKDLTARITLMRKAAARVQKRAPQVMKRHQEQLREKLKQAGLDRPFLEDQRVLQEIVLFSDRADISEELSRLQSHFLQFDHSLKATDPVGRTLDFLAQEMHREINTIGSKANDPEISKEVVTLKTELEKFREQAQNVE